jgi:DNA ligase-1
MMLYSTLIDCLAKLEATTKRNEMMAILAGLLCQATGEEIDKVVYLCQERLAPAFNPLEFGIGEALAATALAKAASGDDLFAAHGLSEVKRLYREVGDYGSVAESLLSGSGQGLSVADVHARLWEIATASGDGTVATKTDLLAQLLNSLSGREARYTLRIPLGRLRLGIGDPTIMDALSFARSGDKSLRGPIERAYNVCSDLGLVARTLWNQGTDGLLQLTVQVGNPVRMALAERAASAEEIIQRLGTCSLEGKYDGFRCQVHYDGRSVRIFSRNLEETTPMFPDVADGIRRQVHAESIILEGEALAYDVETDDFLPFQVTVQRKRKHGIDAMQEKLPLRLVAFDLLYLNGQDRTADPLSRRRELLSAAIGAGDTVQVSEALVTGDPAVVDTFFMDKVSRGLEGIMAKRLDSPYQAGARNFNWIKLKRSYQGALSDTVDCVVVGYFRGKGMRAAFGIGALLTAVYDQTNDRFVTVAKLGTGLSEEEWVRIREMLDAISVDHRPPRVESLITPDVWTEPHYVMELKADEITRSPLHTCGRASGNAGYASRASSASSARTVGPRTRLPRARSFPCIRSNHAEPPLIVQVLWNDWP